MNRTTVYIQNDVISVILVLMYSNRYLSFYFSYCCFLLSASAGTRPFFVFVLIPPASAKTRIRQRPQSPVAAFDSHYSKMLSLLFFVFASLISHCAGSFTCRLTGSLALAASAFFYCMVQCLSIQCFNMFHLNILLIFHNDIAIIAHRRMFLKYFFMKAYHPACPRPHTLKM